MKDVMVDLETMGSGPMAAIISIGAVEFDPVSGLIGESFYEVVNLKSSVENGGIIDPDTVMWWLGQSGAARLAVRSEAVSVETALMRFGAWLSGCAPCNELRVWGNGADFDNVILATAFDRAGIVRPWKFWNNRCYRTMKSLHKDVPLVRTGTHHNALDDARTQAEHLIAIMAVAKGEV